MNMATLLKIKLNYKHNCDIYKRLTLIKKFLCKFKIIILFENANLKTANWADSKIYKS